MDVIKEIKGNTYKKLIEYASDHCDAVMTVIRRDMYVKSTDKNEVDNFNNTMKTFTEKLKPYLLKKRDGGNWVYSKVIADKELFEVCFYQFNDVVKNVLLNNDNLYKWLHPNFPEDIAFFKNGYCWLYSVAHEKICEIYYESNQEYEELVKLGIEFGQKYFLPKNDRYYEEYHKGTNDIDREKSK